MRTPVAAFDAVALAIFAYARTGGFGSLGVDLMLWGSAAAAAIAAFVVAMDGPAVVGWIAIGYILFAGLLLSPQPQLLLIALAGALTPVRERPPGSPPLRIAVAG